MSEKVILHIRDYPGGPSRKNTQVCTLYTWLINEEHFNTKQQPPYVFTEAKFLKLCENKYFLTLLSDHVWSDKEGKDNPCGNRIEMRPEFRFVLILKKVIK